MSPEGALGTDLAFRIVDLFFVRAADDAVRDDDGPGTMLTDEGQDLFSDGRVSSNVVSFREPTLEGVGFRTLRGNDRSRREP
jgi:hypothetical protein